MTPGYGKTLVAAYLIGSRSTARHAAVLGGIVTLTHTASVIAVGLLALLASRFVVPNALMPALETCAGLLVIVMGIRLVWTRWGSLRDGHYDHQHLSRDVRPGDLLAMGVSGGLVPCPEALGVMLIAIGLDRIVLGLGLILAFGCGLTVVLVAIGTLLVRFRSKLDRLGKPGGPWQRRLPLISAGIVTFLGVAIVLEGLMAYAA